jgi:hypothetical protein
MSRFAIRALALLLLLAVVAAVPFVYREVEQRRQFSSFQGEWDVVGGKPHDAVRVSVRGADVKVELIGYTYDWRLTKVDTDKGLVDVLCLEDDRVYGPCPGFYKFDGDRLLITFDSHGRPFLWKGKVVMDKEGFGNHERPVRALPDEPAVMLRLARRGAKR